MTPFNVLIHEKRVEKGLSVKTDPIYFYSDEYNAFVDAIFKKSTRSFHFPTKTLVTVFVTAYLFAVLTSLSSPTTLPYTKNSSDLFFKYTFSL